MSKYHDKHLKFLLGKCAEPPGAVNRRFSAVRSVLISEGITILDQISLGGGPSCTL